MRQLRKSFSPVITNFSVLNWLILVLLSYPEGSKISENQNEIIWLLMVTPIIFRVWYATWTFDFFLNEFFSKKIHYKVLDLDFFHPLGMALRSKVKKIARNFKSETKVGKTSLKWATTKLFHHHLALNKVLLKKWY